MKLSNKHISCTSKNEAVNVKLGYFGILTIFPFQASQSRVVGGVLPGSDSSFAGGRRLGLNEVNFNIQ